MQKENGKMRICGDYKLAINQAAPTDTYLLPLIDEIFANLSGGTHFTKLDPADVFHQLPLNDETKQYTTINTHKGLFHITAYCLVSHRSPPYFNVTSTAYFRA